MFREEEGGEVSFNSFCEQKGPLTPVTVKIKIIYFLESGSVVVQQVRDILELVALHKNDPMVAPPALITNVLGLPVYVGYFQTHLKIQNS